MSIKNSKQVCQRILCTGDNNNEIAQLLGVGYNTVKRYRTKIMTLGLQWSDLADLTEEQVAKKFNNRPHVKEKYAQPDWAYIHKELGRKGVTLVLLYDEYLASAVGKKMSETGFRRAYHEYKSRIAPSMRQERVPGEAMFIDYSGQTVPYYPEGQSKALKAQVFVTTLGYSNMTFVQATATQSLKDWCYSVESALHYYGVAPTTLIPDNLKSAVLKNKPGEAVVITPSFAELADHYDCLVTPARPRKPKDKAPVENHVRIIQRVILARLRNQRFTTLGEINAAILPLLDAFNNKVMRLYKKSRKELFDELDRPVMQQLPAEKFDFGNWINNIKVPIDYHIRVDDHYYSVHHRYIGDVLSCKLTSTTVKFFHPANREAIAIHPRSENKNGKTTKPQHCPSNHRHSSKNKLKQLFAWAKRAGAMVEAFVIRHAEEHPVSTNTLQAGIGLKRLERTFQRRDLNLACQKALEANAITVDFVRSVLENGIYKEASPSNSVSVPPKSHTNIRGRTAYAGGAR